MGEDRYESQLSLVPPAVLLVSRRLYRDNVEGNVLRNRAGWLYSHLEEGEGVNNWPPRGGWRRESCLIDHFKP